jgi:membrane fusion protein (multidrug efflux system)
MSILHSRFVAGLSLTVTISALFCLDGCGKKAAPSAMGPLPVQVATATQQDVTQIGEWVATTDGYVNAQIQPQVTGYLIRQDYREGSEVHKGQVLFEIDPRPLQAVLDETKAQLGQSQAQSELAAINVHRDTPLAAAHALAQSTMDNEIKTEQADQAAVANAQATVEAAELNLEFTKVRSLIDGVAGQAALQVGSLVNTSSVLTSVSQLNPIKVYFYISEQEYLALFGRAHSGGRGDLLNSGSLIPLKLTLANNQVYPHTGRIIFVDRSVSAQTGSLRMAAEFPNPGNLLRPGQFGRISAETDVLHDAVVVPQRAVGELQGMNQVDVVGADNVAHVRTVKLGSQTGTNIVILSGLKAGERVVTEGNDKVRDGAKVLPQSEPASPAPSAATLAAAAPSAPANGSRAEQHPQGNQP